MPPSRHRVRHRRRELADTVTLAPEPLDGPLLRTVRAVGEVARALCAAHFLDLRVERS